MATTSISFTTDDFEIYEYLKSKDNKSKYIIKLIRNDMEGESENFDKDAIRQIIREEMNRVLPTSDKNPEVMNAVNDLLSF